MIPQTVQKETVAGHAVVMGLSGEPLLYNKEAIKHKGFVVCIPEIREKLMRHIEKINEKA